MRIRGHVVKRRMWAARVVELQITLDAGARLAHALVSTQVDLFVLDRFPQAFDEHVVAPAALAIHADGDAVLEQQLGELDAGELAAPSRY